MKKTILITLLALLGMIQMVAQEYEYVPLVREGVKWVYQANGLQSSQYTVEFFGDSVIDGKTYKALHKYHGESINKDNDTIVAFMREENKVVYSIVPDGKMIPECPVGNWRDTELSAQIVAGEEYVLFDFNDPITFLSKYNNEVLADYGDIVFPIISDKVTVGNHLANRYIFRTNGEDYCLVEGVGYDGIYYSYPFAACYGGNGSYSFLFKYMLENDSVIYRGEGESIGQDIFVPLSQTDLQWVYERVCVENGDTVRSYYIYALSERPSTEGYEYDHYYDCYRYAGTRIDRRDDGERMAIIHNSETSRNIISIDNKPLQRMVEEYRNMIDFYDNGYEQCLYMCCLSGSDIDVTYSPNYYIRFQNSNELNRQNLVEVEPLAIDGISEECKRFAYIGEDGEVLAYVVEGIGFDSYDMGDLLTPFTRKPDPNAYYQEWCGLSHVVKDGKIIYKGMRWREGVMTGIDEVVADKSQRRPQDDYYYNLMGQPVGKDVPSAPGIYIHNGKKIIVR
jgi:hypothetical protein